MERGEKLRPHEIEVHETREKKTTGRGVKTIEGVRKQPIITSSGSRPTGRMPLSSFLVPNTLGEWPAEGGNKNSRRHCLVEPV
jgi:hypothetical protein